MSAAAYADTAPAAPSLKFTAVGCSNDDHGATAFMSLTAPGNSTEGFTVTAKSGNTALLPPSSIRIEDLNDRRGLIVSPVAGKHGTAGVTLTETNSVGATSTLTFTVRVGGAGDDTITGTNGRDWVFPNAGKNTVKTLGGDDLICGLYAAVPGDIIDAGAGNDYIDGGSGNDTITGGPGKDMVSGGFGDDTLTGGTQADHFSGGAGTDTITDFNAAEGDTKDGSTP